MAVPVSALKRKQKVHGGQLGKVLGDVGGVVGGIVGGVVGKNPGAVAAGAGAGKLIGGAGGNLLDPERVENVEREPLVDMQQRAPVSGSQDDQTFAQLRSAASRLPELGQQDPQAAQQASVPILTALAKIKGVQV